MSAPEFQLQKSICELLDAAYPQVVYFSVPNGAVLGWSDAERKRAGREWAKLRITGARTGAPDMVLIWRGGVGFLEVKSPTGRLSDEQVAFHGRLRGCEAPLATIRSLDSLQLTLGLWGVPRGPRMFPPLRKMLMPYQYTKV